MEGPGLACEGGICCEACAAEVQGIKHQRAQNACMDSTRWRYTIRALKVGMGDDGLNEFGRQRVEGLIWQGL